ncbi:Abi family protein [Carnobacterium pleistocenium]|uniref:Abi family protein n=1 Tax=Carnobacterium pleistocenium TaxID=181073 RepID=UPI00054D88EC|nr:Abi family protein [Carnobacterium pleistocenium]
MTNQVEQLFEDEEEKKRILEVIKAHKSIYPKKELDLLLDSLEERGVGFNIKNRSEAKEILEELNYFYKITVYKRNFKKNAQRNYINLEFSYLSDIASVDMQLRYILASFTLDIEHSLKTLLMKRVTDNQETDGYDVIEGFIQSTERSTIPLTKEYLFKKARNPASYQHSLYLTHKDCPPIWAAIEVMSFGDLINLFLYYFRRYPEDDIDINSIRGLLTGVRVIRNISVHNNPYLFNLSKGNISSVNSDLKKYLQRCGVKRTFYSAPKIHDILCVLYAHDRFVNGEGSRRYRIESLSSLVEKSIERFSYLDKDSEILYFFKILKLTIDNYGE